MHFYEERGHKMAENQNYNSDNRIPLPNEFEDGANSSNVPHIKSQEELELEFLQQFELDPEIADEPIQPSFRIGDVDILPLGDVAGIKGLAKSAKTMFDVILMAAAMRGEYMGVQCLLEKPRILFADTEQHPRNVRAVYRRACLIARIDGRVRHENLNMMHLRLADDAKQMQKAIFLKIEHFRPQIVFVDGVADLIGDFNDVTESKSVITRLSQIALKFNCCIVLTLHTNPDQDSKMRGHLGTILTQKASDVISCKKDKRPDGSTAFLVEQTENRNGSDFAQFSFSIEVHQDSYGECLAVPVRTYVSSSEKESLDELFRWALADSPLRRADLRDKICSKDCPQKVSRSTAYTRINDAISAGIVCDDDPVTHRLRYHGLPKNDLPF